jgi:hypothetical protein
MSIPWLADRDGGLARQRGEVEVGIGALADAVVRQAAGVAAVIGKAAPFGQNNYLFLILDNKATLNRMRNTMPARPPVIIDATAKKLESLGRQIRAHRKSLRVSAVTMGAYLNAMAALGLDFGIVTPPNPASNVSDDNRKGWIPARIHLPDYPQLKQLAWQVHGTDELTPVEALDIYERNARHLDFTAMEPRERHLIDALRLAFGEGCLNV